MALGNLTINVNANVGNFTGGMQAASAAARQSMQQSTAAVEAFQASADRRAASIEEAMNNMGRSASEASLAFQQSADDSKQAIESLQQAANEAKFDSFSEKVSAAFGAGAGAGYAAAQTWLEKAEDWIKTKLVIIGVAVAAGVTIGAVAAIYSAYKVITGAASFIGGLFTGDSYKSASIDALAAANEKVVSLQQSLQISAVRAGALSDALTRLNVPKDDYVSVFQQANNAMHTNGEELDRLGVKYKDANGNFLETSQFLQNVKNRLDDFKEGWDRNSAAAAIGAGAYDKINEVLSVTDEEIQKSKERLDAYNLGIGSETQAAVEAYQKAMREFDNETRLTGEGFKRAIADQVMPILTDLAEFFKEGFPTAVNAFRYSMATVTSIFYGLKEVVYIVAETVLGSLESIGAGLVGVADAVAHALTGDFSGAKDAFIAGWEDAKKRFAAISDNIVAQSEHNAQAMRQAFGFDNRSDATARSPRQGPRGNEAYPPKPIAAADVKEVTSAYQNFLAELDRMTEKAKQSEYAMLRLKAEQLGAKDGIKDFTEAYRRINELQRNESIKIVELYTQKLAEESEQYKFQTSILWESANAQAALTMEMQKRVEMQQKIREQERSGRPLDDEGRADIQRATDEAIQIQKDAMAKRLEIERSWQYGAHKFFQDYIDDASNSAKLARDAFTNVFQKMEDSLIEFMKTGKFNFRSLVDTIITELARIQAKKTLASFAKVLDESPSFGSFLGGIFGGGGGATSGGFDWGGAYADGGNPPVGKVSLVGERGPELFVPKTAGTIIPNGAMGGSTIAQYISIDARGADAGVEARIRRAMEQTKQDTIAAIANDISRNGAMAKIVRSA